MTRRTTFSRRARLATALMLLLLSTATAALAASSSTTLPNGAQLSISIDTPADGTQFLADGAPVPVPVTGTATIGLGEPQATLVYAFDASGSTAGSGGACGTVLACEKTFFTGLNRAAIASGSVNQVGLVVFGADAVQADMTPAGGDDPLGDPADGNTPISSIVLTNANFNYQVAQYTLKNGDANGTNYAAALQEALSELTASTDAKKFMVFASDGLSNLGSLTDFDNAVAAIEATGTVVNSVAVGASSACSGGTAGDLDDVAVNGGACFTVADPNDLPDIIPSLIGSTLTKVELSVDGGTPTAVATTPPTPQPGPAMLTYSTATAGLAPGAHEICATAFGTDVTGGSGDTSTCVDVGVYDLELAPATATNELGSVNSHTVTATLEGPAGSVGGFPVTFTVGGQNAGATGTCAPADCKTDAAGLVSFTYTVPAAPSSLGLDTIIASVTLADPTGTTDTEQVTKTWEDATAPVVTCTPTTNPSGRNVPPAGSNPRSGQNPDGFYVLTASDAVDPNPAISVGDTGSSFVAGPYASGTKIKLVQAPGATPNVRPGAGVIDWQITLKGDASITVSDGSGNTSTVTCNVPPPPKSQRLQAPRKGERGWKPLSLVRRGVTDRGSVVG